MRGQLHPAAPIAVAPASSTPSPGASLVSLPRFDALGRFAGIIALVISLAHPAFEAWRDIIHQAASTRATNTGSSLELVYDPVGSFVEFRFAAVLQNHGTREDILQDVSASLTTIGDGNVRVLDADVIDAVHHDAQPVSLPYPVQVGSNSLRFAVRAMLDPDSTSLIGTAGERRLVLRLQADDREPLTVAYCFYLSGDLIAGLRESEKLQQRKFIRASCI